MTILLLQECGLLNRSADSSGRFARCLLVLQQGIHIIQDLKLLGIALFKSSRIFTTAASVRRRGRSVPSKCEDGARGDVRR